MFHPKVIRALNNIFREMKAKTRPLFRGCKESKAANDPLNIHLYRHATLSHAHEYERKYNDEKDARVI